LRVGVGKRLDSISIGSNAVSAHQEVADVDPLKPGEAEREAPFAGAHIGKSVVIKGELSGSENLYVDGEVEGSIQLDGHSLTIGQNGRVRAYLKARDIVVQGRVDGNVMAGERLDLRKTAVLIGDIQAQRLAIEDGAFVKGKVETTRPEPQNLAQSRPEMKQAAASTGAAKVGTAPAVSATEPKG
jgi:cytoskeletal protein CcmA (bactofilin family)